MQEITFEARLVKTGEDQFDLYVDDEIVGRGTKALIAAQFLGSVNILLDIL